MTYIHLLNNFSKAFSYNVAPLMVVSIYAVVNLIVVYHWINPCFVSILSICKWPLINTETPIILTRSECFSVGGKSRSIDAMCPSLTVEVSHISAPATVNTKNQFTFIENVCCRHFPEYRTKRSGCYVPVVHYTVHLHLDHNNLTFV